MPEVWYRRQYLEHALIDGCYHCSECISEGLSRALHLREAGVQSSCIRLVGTLPWWSASCWAQEQTQEHQAGRAGGSLEFYRTPLPQLVPVLSEQGSAHWANVYTHLRPSSAKNAQSKSQVWKSSLEAEWFHNPPKIFQRISLCETEVEGDG